ncbi:hypothetical protein ACF06X_07310 [Streptomyces sp. NPDC015346]
MGEHVHVRLKADVRISASGELSELYRCRCGETWTRTYGVEGTEPE